MNCIVNDSRTPVRTFLTAAFLMTVAHCPADEFVRTRTFRLTVDCCVTGLEKGDQLRLWMPEPSTDRLQDVSVTDVVAPTETRVTTETTYGNQLRFLSYDAADDAEVRVRVTRDVIRRAVMPDETIPAADGSSEKWLQPNRLVPVADPKLRSLTPAKTGGSVRAKARAIYDRVLGHVEYRKDEPGYGRGDTLWVCDSRFGNCTDFHSLFISLARTEHIPARFEIGLPLPWDDAEEAGVIAGYHCWAWFQDSSGWVPVDISEADKHPERAEELFGGLPANRVAFSTGRDLILQPPQSGPPLNYFVHPYAEVNGQPVAASQIHTEYSWKRIPLGDSRADSRATSRSQ